MTWRILRFVSASRFVAVMCATYFLHYCNCRSLSWCDRKCISAWPRSKPPLSVPKSLHEIILKLIQAQMRKQHPKWTVEEKCELSCKLEHQHILAECVSSHCFAKSVESVAERRISSIQKLNVRWEGSWMGSFTNLSLLGLWEHKIGRQSCFSMPLKVSHYSTDDYRWGGSCTG